ncbi:Hypothetical protein PHPALM_12491 [Phytophthora palmivora]|uniref:Uncharacterized protein n=1 Tax=Phytophthora palmivora TaxID=4796 RepID=A0A2P4XZL0_9STRA|nr:Hypothetical protein PHPALM_12491 [Phytophthora palmivora]
MCMACKKQVNSVSPTYLPFIRPTAHLVPGNTKRAKTPAVGSFVKFLKTESVTEEYARVFIERDESGKCFLSVKDKFGQKRKAAGPKQCDAVYRQAKLWLLDQFPHHRAALEARLLKMGKTLDNFCLKRDGGGFISKAPPCSKADLKKMLYLFGRASNLALLYKPNISSDASNVLFIHFIRMKPSEEQGLSLFPGTMVKTCSMIAMALTNQAAITLPPGAPLLEILDHPVDTTGLGAPSTAGVEKTPTVYSHVNHVLDRIVAAAGVTADVPFLPTWGGGTTHQW